MENRKPNKMMDIELFLSHYYWVMREQLRKRLTSLIASASKVPNHGTKAVGCTQFRCFLQNMPPIKPFDVVAMDGDIGRSCRSPKKSCLKALGMS